MLDLGPLLQRGQVHIWKVPLPLSDEALALLNRCLRLRRAREKRKIPFHERQGAVYQRQRSFAHHPRLISETASRRPDIRLWKIRQAFPQVPSHYSRDCLQPLPLHEHGHSRRLFLRAHRHRRGKGTRSSRIGRNRRTTLQQGRTHINRVGGGRSENQAFLSHLDTAGGGGQSSRPGPFCSVIRP